MSLRYSSVNATGPMHMFILAFRDLELHVTHRSRRAKEVIPSCVLPPSSR